MSEISNTSSTSTTAPEISISTSSDIVVPTASTPNKNISKRTELMKLRKELRKQAMKKLNADRLARGEITIETLPNGIKVCHQVPGKPNFSTKEFYETASLPEVQSAALKCLKK